MFIEGGGNLIINDNKIFTRNIIVNENEQYIIRNRFNNIDCFTTVYKYNIQDIESADLYGDFYLDLDYIIESEEDFRIVQYDLRMSVTFLNNILKIPIEYIQIYYSGHKGFHVIVPASVFGITPNKKLNLYYKTLAQYIKDNTVNYKTIDTKIYDRVRLFRMVNSINSATGLYKIKINYDYAVSCSYQDLISLAQKPNLKISFNNKGKLIEAAQRLLHDICTEEDKHFKKYTTKITNTKYPLKKCIEKMLVSGAPMGTRNNTSVLLASSLIQSGKSEDETLQILLEWNSTYNEPALKDYEIRTTVKSALKEYNNNKVYGCSSIKSLGFCIGAECNCFK